MNITYGIGRCNCCSQIRFSVKVTTLKTVSIQQVDCDDWAQARAVMAAFEAKALTAIKAAHFLNTSQWPSVSKLDDSGDKTPAPANPQPRCRTTIH
jgi:hypothetical protein